MLGCIKIEDMLVAKYSAGLWLAMQDNMAWSRLWTVQETLVALQIEEKFKRRSIMHLLSLGALVVAVKP